MANQLRYAMFSPLDGTGRNDGNVKKPRIRIPTSCSSCRSKKIKCDRKRPSCSQCINKDNGECCKYEIQRWPKNAPTAEAAVEKLQQEIVALKEKINKLETPPELRRGSTSSTSTSKSLFDNGEHQQKYNDKESNTFNLKNLTGQLSIKHLKVIFFGPTSYMFLLLNDSFSAEVILAYTQDQIEKFKLKSSSLEIQNEARFNKSVPTIDDCSKTELMVPRSFVLPEIPSVKIINRLVQRFFRLCYVFAPFIDERVFMNEISHIFKNKEVIEQEDLLYKDSTIAILLIVLRFAYLTLPLKKYHNDTLSGSDYELISLIENSNVKISTDYVEYAQHIILSPTAYEKASFRKIQAILLLKVYRMYCPEYQNKSSGSNTLVAIAVQMARFHGLHKDPTNFSFLQLDNSDIHLWRKTWAVLVYLDAIQAFESGMPLLVQDTCNDTRVPFRDEFNEFWFPNKGLERSFIIRHAVSALLSKSANLLNQNFHIANLQLVEELAFEFNDILENVLRPFDLLFLSRNQKAELSEVAHEVMLRLLVVHNAYILHYLIYLSTSGDRKEKHQTFAVKYAFTILEFGLRFAEDPLMLVSPEFETLIASQVWGSVHSVVCFLGGRMLKSIRSEGSLVAIIRTFPPSERSFLERIDFSNDESCVQSILREFEQFYNILIKLSIKYYHCYLLCFALRIVLDYFKSNYPDSLQTNILLSTNNNSGEQLGELLPIDEFWNKSDLDPDFTFEEFLSHLNYNLDPFINETT